MAKVESHNEDAKATARHAKIAREKKHAEEKAKQKIEDDKWKAKKAEDRRKEEIKKLPKDQQAKAKAELKEQIKARKAAEREARAQLRAQKHAEKEAAKAVAVDVIEDKQKVEEGINASERQQSQVENETADIAAAVEDTIAPTEQEEGVPGELPADTVESPAEDPDKKE